MFDEFKEEGERVYVEMTHAVHGDCTYEYALLGPWNIALNKEMFNILFIFIKLWLG